MLHDLIIVMHTHPRAMPLAMITIKKDQLMGSLFSPFYGDLLGRPSERRSSAVISFCDIKFAGPSVRVKVAQKRFLDGKCMCTVHMDWWSVRNQSGMISATNKANADLQSISPERIKSGSLLTQFSYCCEQRMTKNTYCHHIK